MQSMPEARIHLSAFSQAEPVQGELLGTGNLASMTFIDISPAHTHAQGVSISYLDGLGTKAFSNLPHDGSGELRCISQACVSDVSLVGTDTAIHTFDTGLLVADAAAGMVHTMNEDISLEALSSELLCSLPQVQQALNGELDAPQISQLISELQSQLLELNSVSQQLFGDFSVELDQAIQEAQAQDSSSLFGELEAGSGHFIHQGAGGAELPVSFEATLDGLFTAPEAFPLTLDFSNQNGFEEATELFAATSGNLHSISSSAHDSDASSVMQGGIIPDRDFS
jgi:hypothetical protein